MAGVSRWSHEELNFQIFVYLVFFFFFFLGRGPFTLLEHWDYWVNAGWMNH